MTPGHWLLMLKGTCFRWPRVFYHPLPLGRSSDFRPSHRTSLLPGSVESPNDGFARLFPHRP